MTPGAATETTDLWRDDTARWASYRANYLARQYNLDDRVAAAVAWSELGYSTSGIAKKVGKAEDTVRAYLDDVADRYGEPAVYARRPDNLAVDADLPINGGEDS